MHPLTLTLSQLAQASPCLTDKQLQHLWVQAHLTNKPPQNHHYCTKRGGLFHIIRASDQKTRGFRASYSEALHLATTLTNGV